METLETQIQSAEFWKNPKKAGETSQKISELKEEIEKIESLKKELDDLKKLYSLSELDKSLTRDLSSKYETLRKKIEKEELSQFLSGKYDKNSAIIEIFSGAGGQDSQDWATMLLRMYSKYSAKQGFDVKVLSQSFGQTGGPEGRIGTKSVTLEIKGRYAYGILKKETGVHRLVRISPFSAKKLRHTSFALVDVLPEIKEEDSEYEIKHDDLKIETFKSSGPGGQYVNKTESAVRITHLPTGIVITSQTERLQGKNKENAMKILSAKLHQLKQERHKKELKDIKGELTSVSWGNQIRSYVLHPYKMVKDLRTQFETSDVDGVLDGNLTEFIEAELRVEP